MIKDGFMYLAVLILVSAVLVNLPKIFKGKRLRFSLTLLHRLFLYTSGL